MQIDSLLILKLLATIAVGVPCGIIFKKLKIPAAYMLGSMAAVTVLSLTTGFVWFPAEARIVVQMIAGAFVGCMLEKSDLMRLRRFIKPLVLMLLSYFILMIIVGFTIWGVSPLSLATALMCSVPGGMSDAPIIAADMGADSAAVTVMQLLRLIVGVGMFPLMIDAFDKLQKKRGKKDKNGTAKGSTAERVKSKQKSWKAVVAAVVVAAVSGILGRMTGIPGLTFTAAIIGVLILKLVFNFAYIPRWLRAASQMFSGCYLGTLLTMQALLSLGDLIVPATILIGGFVINCFFTGRILSKLFGYTRKEGMLIVSPAGATDMALIIEDLGVDNTDVIVMQVIRASFAGAVFPQIVNLIVFLVGGG